MCTEGCLGCIEQVAASRALVEGLGLEALGFRALGFRV